MRVADLVWGLHDGNEEAHVVLNEDRRLAVVRDHHPVIYTLYIDRRTSDGWEATVVETAEGDSLLDVQCWLNEYIKEDTHG